MNGSVQANTPPAQRQIADGKWRRLVHLRRVNSRALPLLVILIVVAALAGKAVWGERAKEPRRLEVVPVDHAGSEALKAQLDTARGRIKERQTRLLPVLNAIFKEAGEGDGIEGLRQRREGGRALLESLSRQLIADCREAASVVSNAGEQVPEANARRYFELKGIAWTADAEAYELNLLILQHLFDGDLSNHDEFASMMLGLESKRDAAKRRANEADQRATALKP
jgi:hypothetical protein